ncbi:hypothetical protein HAX54_022976, partial [Datura stramonium]|nr:hypothetical protein [Datura stramonium]
MKNLKAQNSEGARWLRGTEPDLRDGLRATLREIISIPDSSEPSRWLHGTGLELRDSPVPQVRAKVRCGKIRTRDSKPPRWVRGTEFGLHDGLRAMLRLNEGVRNSSEHMRWLRGTKPKLHDGLCATFPLPSFFSKTSTTKPPFPLPLEPATPEHQQLFLPSSNLRVTVSIHIDFGSSEHTSVKK